MSFRMKFNAKQIPSVEVEKNQLIIRSLHEKILSLFIALFLLSVTCMRTNKTETAGEYADSSPGKQQGMVLHGISIFHMILNRHLFMLPMAQINVSGYYSVEV